MSKTLFCGAISPLFLFTSCSDNDEPVEEQKVYLEIVTEIETRSTNLKTVFSDNDRLSVDAGGAKLTGTYKSGKWALSSLVELEKGKKLNVTALYPFTDTDLKTVPINIENQTDYLYGSASASAELPVARLHMKHALSSLAFNIQGNGKVESISFTMPVEGTLDAASGVVSSGKSGVQTLEVNRDMNLEGWTEEVPDIFVMPNTRLSAVTVKIDGKDYTVNVEQAIGQGMKYIFRLAYAGNLLVLNNISSISMNQYTDDAQTPVHENTLSVTYLSRHDFQVSVPQLDIITGLIDWGDGSEEAYMENATHEYQAGMHIMTLKAVGGSGSFILPSIEYVEEINL